MKFRKSIDKQHHTHWHTSAIIGLLFVFIAGLSLFTAGTENNLIDVTTNLSEPNKPIIKSNKYKNTTTQVVSSDKKRQIIVDRVKLELKGIIAEDDNNIAFISIDGGPTVTVAEGNAITLGLVLEKVKQKHIVVRHTQELERVALQPNHDNISKNISSNAENRTADDTSNKNKIVIVDNEQLGLAETPDGIEKIADNQYVVKREYIANQMNSADIFKEALIRPNDDGGFIVKVIKPGSVFDHLGLRMGDVISDVNSKPMNSITDALAIRDDFNSASELQIRISRSNNPQYLHYFLK